MRRALAYLGFDGSASGRDWRRGVVEVGPPLALGSAAGILDGVGERLGALLWVGYLAIAWAVWIPIAAWLTWRRDDARGEDRA